jgi:hypothetical protein
LKQTAEANKMAHDLSVPAQELAPFAHDVMHMDPESNLLLLRSTC